MAKNTKTPLSGGRISSFRASEAHHATLNELAMVLYRAGVTDSLPRPSRVLRWLIEAAEAEYKKAPRKLIGRLQRVARGR